MESADLRIARLAIDDLEQILPLFDAYHAFFAESFDDTSRRFLEDRITRDESTIFAAWKSASAVGFVQLYPLWSSWYCRRIWFLSDLYVAEEWRKGGIGARLVDHVIAFAKETNASSVMVELPRSEPHLAAFYARLGFGLDEIFELARYRLT